MAELKPEPDGQKGPGIPAAKTGWAEHPLVLSLTSSIKLPFVGGVPAYYFALLFLFLSYLLVKNILLGLLAGLLMVFIVAWEFYAGVKEGGLKNELKNTAIAILVALVVWFGAGIVLATPTPINAIVSCSMRPAYERGDMVFLKGGDIKTLYVNYAGPVSDINSTAVITWSSGTWPISGSLLAYCSYDLSNGGKDGRCQAFLREPGAFIEAHGPLQFTYGTCPRAKADGSGSPAQTICVRSTTFEGKPVAYDSSYDLIVYGPKQGELYSRVGDIVHRVRLAVRGADGTAIYLTKGDNNPVFDLQAYDYAAEAGNSPVQMSQIRGHVFARLPFIGNLKLFITPQILADPASQSGCDTNFVDGYR